MKHKKGIALFLLLFCVVIVASVINTPEKRTIRYFNSHRATLLDMEREVEGFVSPEAMADIEEELRNQDEEY